MIDRQLYHYGRAGFVGESLRTVYITEGQGEVRVAAHLHDNNPLDMKDRTIETTHKTKKAADAYIDKLWEQYPNPDYPCMVMLHESEVDICGA